MKHDKSKSNIGKHFHENSNVNDTYDKSSVVSSRCISLYCNFTYLFAKSRTPLWSSNYQNLCLGGI